MSNKTEVTEIPINKIRPAPWQPRETFEKEKIAALGESLKEKGIIQPIVVRKNKTGDGYQIIAGERRWRAWEYTGKKTIPAVIKDVDDFTAKELSIIENWHREDLSESEKEKFISNLWIEGFKAGKYTSYSDMMRKTGISESTISRTVEANAERHSLKNSPMAKVVKNATARDLAETRHLKEVPEAREELLKIRVEKPELLNTEALRNVVKVIKDVPLKSQAAVVRLISDAKLEPKNVEQFVKVLTESAPDVQKKLLKQEITTEEAEAVKIFKTPEQRSQVIQERKILAKGYKEDDQRHVSVRKKMAEDVESGKKPTTMSVRFDSSGRDDDASAKRTLERYQNIHLEVLSYRADHILSIKNKEMQEQCIDVVKRTMAHCNQVLQGVAELRPLLIGEKAKR